MPRKDPIIEEIHAVREKMAREAAYDLEKMLGAGPSTAGDERSESFASAPRKSAPTKKAS